MISPICSIFKAVTHSLTLILLEAKVTSLCNQYRARPACISVGWLTSYNHLDILGQFQNRTFIPFKQFSRLRVNIMKFTVTL